MPKIKTASLTVPAGVDSVARCAEFVAEWIRAAGFPLARLHELELVIEEVVVNICQHAYGDAAGEIELLCATDSAGNGVLEFIDSGKPFDMLTLPAPDLTAKVEQRPVGGLGVPLVRAMVEEATYRREGGRNMLRLLVRLAR